MLRTSSVSLIGVSSRDKRWSACRCPRSLLLLPAAARLKPPANGLQLNQRLAGQLQPPCGAVALDNGTLQGQPAAVDYSVGPCSYSCSIRLGNSGKLLRLVEQSDDCEYVLLLPASTAGILHEVLEKAVSCLASARKHPLELHHHILQSSRTFTVSLTYNLAAVETAAAANGIEGSNGNSNSQDGFGAVDHVARVTVQERDRSSVQLLVTHTALPAVQQLMALLQVAEGSNGLSSGSSSSNRNNGTAGSTAPAVDTAVQVPQTSSRAAPGVVPPAAAGKQSDNGLTSQSPSSGHSNNSSNSQHQSQRNRAGNSSTVAIHSSSHGNAAACATGKIPVTENDKGEAAASSQAFASQGQGKRSSQPSINGSSATGSRSASSGSKSAVSNGTMINSGQNDVKTSTSASNTDRRQGQNSKAGSKAHAAPASSTSATSTQGVVIAADASAAAVSQQLGSLHDQVARVSAAAQLVLDRYNSSSGSSRQTSSTFSTVAVTATGSSQNADQTNHNSNSNGAAMQQQAQQQAAIQSAENVAPNAAPADAPSAAGDSNQPTAAGHSTAMLGAAAPAAPAVGHDSNGVVAQHCSCMSTTAAASPPAASAFPMASSPATEDASAVEHITEEPSAGDSPEHLLASIFSSSTLAEGMQFAHAASAAAAAANALSQISSSSTNSSSSDTAEGSFTALHLVALWSLMTKYAAVAQAEMLGLPAEELPTGQDGLLDLLDNLHPVILADVQVFADLLVPLLQPQVQSMPSVMLQLLLASAAQVGIILPDTFLQSWVEAATATDLSEWTDGQLVLATQRIIDQCQQGQQLLRQQQQQQVSAVQDSQLLLLPQAWVMPVLQDATSRLVTLLQQQQVEAHTAARDKQQAGDMQVKLLVELVVVLLVGSAENLERHGLLWGLPVLAAIADSHASISGYTGSSEDKSSSENFSKKGLAQSSFSCLSQLVVPMPGQQQQPDRQQIWQLSAQKLLLQYMLELPSQQREYAHKMVWSWLAVGGGAQQLDSSNILWLLQQLPYSDAALAYQQCKGSSQQRSLLARALLAHAATAGQTNYGGCAVTTSALSSGGGGVGSTVGSTVSLKAASQQVAAVDGLLGHALLQDPPAAFAALPALLQLLPPSHAQDARQANSSSSNTSAAGAATGQGPVACVRQLCSSVRQMLELDPQQLLLHGPLVARALSLQAAAAASERIGYGRSSDPDSDAGEVLLHVLLLVRDLAAAAESWQKLQGIDKADASSSTRCSSGSSDDDARGLSRAIAGACLDTAPAWVAACLVQQPGKQQQSGQQQLSWLAEVLQSAAELHDMSTAHSSRVSRVNRDNNSRSSSKMASSSTAVWRAVEPVLLSAAAQAAGHPLMASDLAAATAALACLGNWPQSGLLELYLEAVRPDPLSLKFEGLCHLLWLAAGTIQQHQQQGQPLVGASAATADGSIGLVDSYDANLVPQLLQLASQACSALAVRSSCHSNVLPALLLARITWAVATITQACETSALLSAAPAGATRGQMPAWQPPRNVLPWLYSNWQALLSSCNECSAAAVAACETADSSSSSDAVQGASCAIYQLVCAGQLQVAEVQDVTWSLQKLDLLQQVHPGKSSRPVSSSSSSSVVPASPAAVTTTSSGSGSSSQSSKEDSPSTDINRSLKHQGQQPLQQEHTTVQKRRVYIEAAPAAAAGSQQTVPSERVAYRADVAPAQPPAPAVSEAAAIDAPIAAVDEVAYGAAYVDNTAATRIARTQQQLQSEDVLQLPIATVMQHLRDITAAETTLTYRQALQLLSPIRQHAQQLTGADLVLYTQACLEYKVDLPATQLVAAAEAIEAAAGAGSAEQARAGLVGSVAVDVALLLKMLSALAAAVGTANDSNSSSSYTAAVAVVKADQAQQQQQQQMRQQVCRVLSKLHTVLPRLQLGMLSAKQLVQLLSDTNTLVAVVDSSSRAQPSAGMDLFEAVAVHKQGGSAALQLSASAALLPPGWLSDLAESLEPKLLLMPNGSMLLQSFRLLQDLGLQNPGDKYLSSFFKAADALLDTFSGSSCLELLCSAALAGRLPNQQLVTAILQHLIPLQLAPADVAAGLRVLAALRIRPSSDLLVKWFSITAAVANKLQPQQVLQMLWAFCEWQLLPPTQWMHAILKGLMGPGRLSSCSPATVAGICHCLWKLGVQPSLGFTAAIVEAAQHAILTAAGRKDAVGGEGGSHHQQQQQQQQRGVNWQQWQQGRQQQPQQRVQWWDAESLSVLVFCLTMWRQPATPTWLAAIAAQAAVVMPEADGPSLLRLAVCLTSMFGVNEQSNHFADWQSLLLDRAQQLLPLLPDAAGELTISSNNTGDSGSSISDRKIPVAGLALLYSGVLEPQPEVSGTLLKALIDAIKNAAASDLLTAWDLLVLVDVYAEYSVVLAHTMPVTQEQAADLLDSAHVMIIKAYQEREGAPAYVLQALPDKAAFFQLEMPKVCTEYLKVSVEAAVGREQQLRKALLLFSQGGPAIPETLIQGFAELRPEDGVQGVQEFLESPTTAVFLSRFRRVGADVSPSWVLGGMQG